MSKICNMPGHLHGVHQLPGLQVHREGKMCSSTPWSKGRAHRAQKENGLPPATLLYLIGCTIPIQGHADFIFSKVFTGQSNPSSKRNLPQSTGQNILEQHLKELKIGSLRSWRRHLGCWKPAQQTSCYPPASLCYKCFCSQNINKHERHSQFELFLLQFTKRWEHQNKTYQPQSNGICIQAHSAPKLRGNTERQQDTS